MHDRTQSPEQIDVQVTARDEPPDVAEYSRRKIGELTRYASRPVLHARVRLTRHRDPAVQRPVVAQANLDVDGRPVRAQVQADTAREAVDLLAARLRGRLQRAADRWGTHRGEPPAGTEDWRHEVEPAHQPNRLPRQANRRRVIRRKSFTLAPCTLDEAAREMELLDYDFHLFTEKGTGTAGVLYRGGPTGYRLALAAPGMAERVSRHTLPVTISQQPLPCLTEEGAEDRLAMLGLPFLFFIHAAYGCASVLYHRYDGHYGLITPAG
ncbi:integrase [Mycobacterium paraffinicum]|uniref:Integrase n=1 Tax=Mycobacterium paraffinicum TaxID=53378 RepID=A0A1Q4HTB6_9MYCO|nr:HPF/RaiA family ribosome-associated protein [Mycobacterium paraffinicum]OJZ72851.1 integrase [Mycobacterium paraffinicum]